MISHRHAFVVAPDWLVPIESQPIHRGLMVIVDGRIEFMGSELPNKYHSLIAYRLTGYAILPGLVNAHCHLEFSDLRETIPADGSFPDWIRTVIGRRAIAAASPEELLERRRAAIAQGVLESYSAGVRCVVDMATSPWDRNWVKQAVDEAKSSMTSAQRFVPEVPITVIPCAEIIDISEPRRVQTLQLFLEQKDAPEIAGLGRFGLAPHASYTASAELTAWAGKVCQNESRLASIHLAESLDEMQWILDRTGPFANFLGPMVSENYLRNLGSIHDRVQSLVPSWRTLVAHGNYLETEELKLLAEHRSTMAIVHCPRTHLHFGHRHESTTTYPLDERTSLGVRHFVGTDSRASNPDLNLWNEVQTLHAHHPNFSAQELLRMITTDAARFLNLSPGSFGFVEPGAIAAVTAVSLAPVDRDRLYVQLVQSTSRACPLEDLLVDGQSVALT